jgi:hypothetical protein
VGLVGMYLATRALSRRGLGGSREPGPEFPGVVPGVYWDFNQFLCMYCKIYINYRGARQIAWLMFQTLLRRSALAAVFSSAVWVRDKSGSMYEPCRNDRWARGVGPRDLRDHAKTP